MARSASVSRIVYIGVLICILQTSVTPVVRNKFTPPANVSVFVLHIVIVVKVARGGSVFKPRGSSTASVSVFLILVCYLLNVVGISCSEC